MTYQLLKGGCLEVIKGLPEASVQTCVTSPPYWALRDYGEPGQIGLEKTPEEYVSNIVAVFEEVRRVLRKDGTLWLNLGDTYNSRPCSSGISFRRDKAKVTPRRSGAHDTNFHNVARANVYGLKPKDLIGIPWRVAFALQAAGWYLRCDIIWSKPNGKPESVKDRPERHHEYIFLLSKSRKYFYNHKAILEPYSESYLNDMRHKTGPTPENEKEGYEAAGAENPKKLHRLFTKPIGDGRNKRSVWTVPTIPFKNAHFAVFPQKLIEPCILAGSRPGDTVLDPFNGSGTTGVVSVKNFRSYIGIDLNPKFLEMSRQNIEAAGALFSEEK